MLTNQQNVWELEKCETFCVNFSNQKENSVLSLSRAHACVNEKLR